MATDFDSGEATVDVFFPVDKRGAADVCCYQCWYFRRNYQTCGLNGEICQYPSKFVGSMCPLKLEGNDGRDVETD